MNADIIGNRTRVKVVKNKCAPPFRQAEFDILYDQGISHESLLIDIGTEFEIIEKSGSWYSYGDLRLGQGKENSREFLLENPDILEEVEARVRMALGLTETGESTPEAGIAEDEAADESVEAVKALGSSVAEASEPAKS